MNIIDKSKEKLWYIVRINDWPPESIPRYETTVLKLGGSVIKNDTLYSALLYTKESDLLSWDTIGFIRETNHQVFCWPISNNSESLLYDFNITMSSTVPINNPFFGGDPQPIPFTVVQVDSVLIGSDKRRRISFD